MENILTISGNVKYTITLDPGVWIFDDRRVDLNTHFTQVKEISNSNEAYTKAVSKHWDREIMEGAIYPPTLKTEKKFEKEKVLTGTFGIPFKPFLLNSEPAPDAKSLLVRTTTEEIEFPLETAYNFILGYSNNGKPLTSDGPVHIYFADGSNKDNPIKDIIGFTIK
ncbi:peptidyl-prolyl cis-trans isomerase [Neobacillus drentensis]|uniref:peptidyl-prolyl cis-trans isomerase n=1 Tax=Neobacillus drentensis TaxID=220684 RepID=UPI002FFF771D